MHPLKAKQVQNNTIVDDDPAIMHYLQILLTLHYHIISRLNSTNIFQTITDEAPDLILSDVLMPDKDGYQLCKEIKRTCNSVIYPSFW